ncbi:MAG: sigma D regulator [Methylococcaceae bacterium]|jgi:regulator of sigma D|nr:sigma D regulator [Methylococcaceae bacterium]
MTETPLERQAHDHRVVEELLNERQQLWSLFNTLGTLRPFTAGQPLETRLREFCQVLVDYISLGHFEMYPRLTDVPERRARVQALANTLYPKFMEATDAAIEFNDKYESLTGATLGETLEPDLSLLGSALTARFELEDQLIAAMAD